MQSYTDDEIIQILKYFDFNWILAANHLGCDPDELRNKYESHQTARPTTYNTEKMFEASNISKEAILMSQQFIKENLEESLPVLFNKDLTEEQKTNIAKTVLMDLGFSFSFTNEKEFIDGCKSLENEALLLEKWREQGQYLTVLEDSVLKILHQLKQQHK